MFTCDVSVPFCWLRIFACNNDGILLSICLFSDKLCFYAFLLDLPGCLSHISCLPQPSVSVYCGVAYGDSHIMVCQHCCHCILYHHVLKKIKKPGHFHAHNFVNKSMSMIVVS